MQKPEGNTWRYDYDLADTNADVVGLDDGEMLQDVFTYTVFDGTKSDTTTLTITIKGNNDGPTAVDDFNMVMAGMPGQDTGLELFVIRYGWIKQGLTDNSGEFRAVCRRGLPG